MTQRLIRKSLVYLVLGILSVLFLVPFYIILRNSFMNDREIIARSWKFWAEQPQLLSNIRSIFMEGDINIAHGLKNSAVIAVIQTLLHLLFASMAGYALARIPFKFKEWFLGLILMTMMIPIYVTFIPTYIVVMKLGLVNTLSGIILPATFNTFSTFMYRQFFLDFPSSLEEAGMMDGLNYFGIWTRLVMPNAIGISIALGVINFFRSWNAFLWPMVIGQDHTTWTIQVMLSQYITNQRIILHNVFLGSLIALLPILVIFFILQKFIVQGVTLSGTKG